MILTQKEIFHQESYQTLKQAIENIADEVTQDIYVLSFFYWCEDDDLRYPSITLGYNTETHFSTQIQKTDDSNEARWNSAFWLLNNIAKVGGKDDDLLKNWFIKTPYYFSDEDNEKSLKDKIIYEENLEKGNQFNDEFMEIIVFIVKKLFSEKVIENKFGKNIPLVIHDFLEYDWTLLANERQWLGEFLDYYDL